MAGVSVGVNIGIPAPVYVAPALLAPPPPPVVYQPVPFYYGGPAIVIGWHGRTVTGTAIATGRVTTGIAITAEAIMVAATTVVASPPLLNRIAHRF